MYRCCAREEINLRKIVAPSCVADGSMVGHRKKISLHIFYLKTTRMARGGVRQKNAKVFKKYEGLKSELLYGKFGSIGNTGVLHIIHIVINSVMSTRHVEKC